jgi:hypothetical protein
MAGTGTFNIDVQYLTNPGENTITITRLSSGTCFSDIDMNNEATFLPITLLSFTGQRAGSAILLEWRTASEENNDYVAVERSADGRAFDEIGRVPGQGDSYAPRDYSFRDEYPLPGINYYRLRQVDFDGTTEYHPVIAVAFEGDSRLGLRAFPNPTEDDFRIQWTARGHARAQSPLLRLLDGQGRLLSEHRLTGSGGVFSLPAANLPAGVYVVQIVQGGERETVRVVKM